MSQGIAYRAGLSYLRPNTPGSGGPHLVRHRGKYFTWSGGCYRPISDDDVKGEVTQWSARNEGVRLDGTRRVPVTASFIRDVMLAIMAETRLDSNLEPGDWIADRPADAVGPFISTRDSILDLGRMTAGMPARLDATPNFFSLAALPHNPDPTAEHPIFSAFLEDTFGAGSPNIPLVQEMFGYSMLPDCRFEKAFVWRGDGNAGKSTLNETLMAMLGAANISAIPLDRLGERFGLPAMIGKLANIVSDASEVEKSAEGVFKSLVSGEPVAVEDKYSSVATMRLTAKQIIITNVLPKFHDTTDGVWRRLQLIPFDRVRREGQRDVTLKTRLHAELPAITGWGLRGLARLLHQGHFTSVEQNNELLRRYRDESNPVGLFLSAECEADPNGRVSRQALYQRYVSWAKDNGHSPLSSTRFNREVNAIYLQPTEPPRDRRGGDRMFVGVRLHHQADVYEHLRLLTARNTQAS